MYHAAFVDESGALVKKPQYYTSAIPYLSAVANNPNYALDPSFDHIFNPTTVHGIESIFEVNFTTVTTNGQQGYALATLCGPRTAGLVAINDTINYGWGFNQPTQTLVDFFKSQKDSIRLKVSVFDTLELQNMYHILNPKLWLIWQNPVEGYWDGKHYSNPHTYNGAFSANGNSMVLLRLADIDLLLAEALVQSGGSDPAGHDAAYYVNLVRSRVKRPSLTSVTMDDIKLERHLELALEGDRYFDLVRWGDASTALVGNTAAGVFSYDDGVPGKSSNGLWPIPYSEIIRTKGFLQNPGYK
jgi:hypothetical protein